MCIYTSFVVYIIIMCTKRGIIHTGVGFCVARSNDMGNAKASKCGTGDELRSHAFFVYDYSN